MALQLSHTTREVAEFSGDMLVTGVRFIFNKFPPSNMQWRAIAPIIAVENCLQVKGLTYWEGFGQMMRGVGIFPVGRQKIPKMIKVAEIVGKLNSSHSKHVCRTRGQEMFTRKSLLFIISSYIYIYNIFHIT